MSLKPWREIARPHKDVLEGTFKQSEFAADITQVANGTATPEYQDGAEHHQPHNTPCTRHQAHASNALLQW